MNQELIAAVIAALVAIAAGFHKAKGIVRSESTVDAVVALLRQEVTRLDASLAAARIDRDALLQENAKLRTLLEARDRDHHDCQMTVNRLTYQLEQSHEHPKPPDECLAGPV